MNPAELIQGSEEWKQYKCGKVGASKIADIIAKTKSGWSASRQNYCAALVCEILTGNPTEGFVSDAMKHGTEKEPLARLSYEFREDVEVQQVGFIDHPTIEGAGASPDGLVGIDGMIEIKVPYTATHIETLLTDEIDRKYLLQMQWQMACTGRTWNDYVSFDDQLPEAMRLYVKRVHRDERLIAELTTDVQTFIGEVRAKVKALRERYELETA